MKDKVKDMFEIQWMPAIVTIVTMSIIMISCFGWLCNRIDRQCDRTDKLYEMFIDLLKEKKA